MEAIDRRKGAELTVESFFRLLPSCLKPTDNVMQKELYADLLLAATDKGAELSDRGGILQELSRDIVTRVVLSLSVGAVDPETEEGMISLHQYYIKLRTADDRISSMRFNIRNRFSDDDVLFIASRK